MHGSAVVARVYGSRRLAHRARARPTPTGVPVSPERLARLGLALGAGLHGSAIENVLGATTEMLGVTFASIAVVGSGEHLGAMARSAPDAGPADELQFTLGEGPCVDADRSRGPILEPDLALAGGLWPAFAPAAVAAGLRAAFVLPLRIGAARVGVLGLYRDTAGELAPDDLADAVAIANVITHLLLEVEEQSGPGVLPGRLRDVVAHRREVHQATGMVAAQLDVDTGAALARLRAWAWSRGRTLDAVATEVLDGTLRFRDL